LYTNVLFWSNACTVGSTLIDSATVKQWVDMNCCAPPSLFSHLGNILFTQFSLTTSIYLEKISQGLSKRPTWLVILLSRTPWRLPFPNQKQIPSVLLHHFRVPSLVRWPPTSVSKS
jgi:hypothetical protein